MEQCGGSFESGHAEQTGGDVPAQRDGGGGRVVCDKSQAGKGVGNGRDIVPTSARGAGTGDEGGGHGAAGRNDAFGNP